LTRCRVSECIKLHQPALCQMKQNKNAEGG
jgi:hypothetical protein